MTARRPDARAVATVQLPPIRVLPIPENRPPAISPDDLSMGLGDNMIDHSTPYIQDALAFELMPRRSDIARRVPSCDLPEVGSWLRRTVQALIEVMAGLRPPAHVVRACSPEVYLAVARRHGAMLRRAAGREVAVRPPAVVRVHPTRPVEGIVEAAIVLVHGPRVRALALRAEATANGWCIVALQLA